MPVNCEICENCYSLRYRLFIISGGEIQSMKGTTQGDSAAMTIYATIIISMILMLVEIILHGNCNTFTAAYAEDLNAARTIYQLKKWLDELCRLGPKLGYYPEGGKSWLVFKKKKAKESAESIFKYTNIKITTEGKRQLGVVIGTINY